MVIFGIQEIFIIFGILIFVAGIIILYFSLSDQQKVKIQKQKKTLSRTQNTKISKEELEEIVDSTKELVRKHSKETAKVIQQWLKDNKNQ